MLGAVGEATDDDARQAVLALEPHEVALVGDHLQDQAAGLVGDDLAPARLLRRRHRRLADAEVLGALGVGGDDQALAMVLHARTRGRARAAPPGAGRCRARSASIR